MITVNMRSIRGRSLTGVQRYGLELIERLPMLHQIDAPEGLKDGIKGQIWDQVILPSRIKGLLWSPSNLGPVSYPRQVLTLHDISPVDHPEWFDKRYVQMTKLILPRVTKNVRHIITVSEFSRRRIIEQLGLATSKVTSIPLAAGSQFAPMSTAEQEKCCIEKGWPQRYFLSVGSLEPRKNLRKLFLAWEAWASRPPELRLLVAGGQGKVFADIGFKKIPDGVTLLGRIDDFDLPLIYACAEAFIYPSVYEGFGLPPLEAMASGTPVITSGVSSLPEVVGNAALLVDPYNINEITAALTRLADNPMLRQEMREAGLLRARRFDWQTTADLTLQILKMEEER